MNFSHEGTKARRDKEEVASVIVDCAFRLHKELGPGLMETVCEVVLAKMLEQEDLEVERQKTVPIIVDEMKFDEGFRADLIVENTIIIELKSVENLSPLHSKQLLTYLRLLNLPLGLLINFGAEVVRNGIKRIVNGPQSFEKSPLFVNRRIKR